MAMVKLKLFPTTPEQPLKYFKLQKDAKGKGTGKFVKFAVAQTQDHGLGFGDINNDGGATLS